MSKRNLIIYGLIFVCLALSVFWVEPSPEREYFRIVFESHRDGNGEIYVMDADGCNQIRLTHNRVMDRKPSWLRVVSQPATPAGKSFAPWGCPKRIDEPY